MISTMEVIVIGVQQMAIPNNINSEDMGAGRDNNKNNDTTGNESSDSDSDDRSNYSSNNNNN